MEIRELIRIKLLRTTDASILGITNFMLNAIKSKKKIIKMFNGRKGPFGASWSHLLWAPAASE